jgi:hypothetical protein
MTNPTSSTSHPRRRARRVASAAALLVTLTTALPEAAPDVIVPPMPANLEVTDGSTPYLIGRAYGTQNYICQPSSSGVAWTLFGPQATLFNDRSEQIATHFLSANPDENGTLRATWQHSRDTSAVWARAVQNSTDPNYVAPGAVAWLLLRVVGTEYGPGWGDKLTRTTWIQRVNTSGGVPPASGCSAATDLGRTAVMPYSTDYIFYR